MVDLKVVQNESEYGKSQAGLLTEYARHFKQNINELSNYHREMHQIIAETTMSNYFYPYNAAPWQKEYHGSIDYLDNDGNHVTIEHVRKYVSTSQRKQRATWLMDYAFNCMITRAQDLQVGICTPWSSVITPILYSTYKAMALQHPKHLISYRDLVTPVSEGGQGVVGQARTKTVRNKWSEQVFRVKLSANLCSDDNPYAPVREIFSTDMPEFAGELDNQRRFFYTRVNGRAAFCHKAIMWTAHELAFDRLHGRDHWLDKIRWWEEELGHDRAIIDFIYNHHTKNDQQSNKWVLGQSVGFINEN